MLDSYFLGVLFNIHFFPTGGKSFAGTLGADLVGDGGGRTNDGSDQESVAKQIGAGAIECGAVGEGFAEDFQNTAGAYG